MRARGITIAVLILTGVITLTFSSQPSKSEPEISAHEPILEWSKTFGGTENDQAYFVQQVTDGGYIIVGSTASFGAGSYDVLLIKTDLDGNMLWNKTYGGSEDDEGYSVQQTTDGGYIIMGGTRSFGNGFSALYLIKTDPYGTVLWNKTYRDQYIDYFGRSVQQASDGGYVIVCLIDCYPGMPDISLWKTDSDGDLLWQKTYGGPFFDEGYSVDQTTDGGFIVVGYSDFGGGASDVLLIKTDLDGNMLWNKTYGGSEDDEGYSVQQTTDGGYIIVGETRSFSLRRDIYLIKTDSNGDLQWNKTFGGSNYYEARSVRQSTDGGYIIAGSNSSSYYIGNQDVYLIKTDSDGNMLWNKTFGGSENDCGWMVQETLDGGYIMVGYTISYGAGARDVYLVKLTPP